MFNSERDNSNQEEKNIFYEFHDYAAVAVKQKFNTISVKAIEEPKLDYKRLP